uniref:RNase H type-1 domain-containing protein n=1 Tax=Cannabis sativa TaxID=3483 RepID=A0A803NJQ6_CANSA
MDSWVSSGSSNRDDGVRHAILSTLHLRAADDHSFYLGLLIVTGRNKNVAFGFLKEKVRKCIQNWDSKQGWQLLTNPSSLVAQVFQARYYPQCTFLDAELGFNPSYTWRSVFEAQESMGELKDNCDAALFLREKSHGLGWITRNHDGVCIAVAAVKNSSDLDPLVAEAMSLKEALS